MGAFAYLYATDATCRFVGTDSEARALDGSSVTVEAASDSVVTGKFDLQSQKGELHGTFDARLCSAAAPAGTTRTCRP